MRNYQFQALPQLDCLPDDKLDLLLQDKSGSSEYDASILVYHDVAALKQSPLALLAQDVPAAADGDAAFDKNVNVIHLAGTGGVAAGRRGPGSRVITSCVGKLNRDYDDVRRYAEAVGKAVRRAKAAKWTRPLLILQAPPPAASMASSADFSHFVEVALLAALAESHEQLQARETAREPLPSIERMGVAVVEADGKTLRSSLPGGAFDKIVRFVGAVETGRRLARDIGGADPERMTALQCAEAVQSFFADKPEVRVSVMRERGQLTQNYPLLMAVARGSEPVERHAPCVISLEYRSPDQSAVEEELFLVGKGVTYDTGGMDVKTNGIMVNMSKDKCGAAAMAGFLAVVAAVRPRHLNVTCRMAMVRNSIGSNGYVADEILVGRSGVRVRVGNTDAEGRMAMADVLCEMRELASRLPDPARARLFTCATLTGHARNSVGAYPIAMDNGPARRLGMAGSLASIGEALGDPVEVSQVRRDDFKAIEPKNNCYDVEQITPPSLRGIRGHQYPAAFLAVISGLEKEPASGAGNGEAGSGQRPRLAYTHLDIAGVMDDGESGKPTAIPVVSLAGRFLHEGLCQLRKLP